MQRRLSTANLPSTVLAICAVAMVALVARREFGQSVRSTSLNWESEFPLVARPERLHTGAHLLVGRPDAKVRVVVFGDFECPACKVFAESALRGLGTEEINSVAVYHRHYILDYHRFGYPAARAAECAFPHGRFREFHDALYARQDSLGLRSFSQYAVDAGIADTMGLIECIEANARHPQVDGDLQLASDLALNSTPTVFINGRRLPGVPDSTRLSRLVRQSLDQ